MIESISAVDSAGAVSQREICETSTALTVVERAQVALNTKVREAALIALAAASRDLVEIRDSASFQQVHGARMERKRARIDVEYTAEKAREDANNFSKAMIAEQKRLVAIVQPEESRLEAMEVAYNAKVAAEKEAKRKAEQERIARIQALIAEIREYAITDGTAATIAVNMDQLEQFQIDAGFGEFAGDAEQVKVAVMNKLNAAHAQAVDREAAAKAEAERLAAEQARLKAEREELERQQAIQAERQRKEEEDLARRRAEQDAREQAERNRIEAARIQQEGIERAARDRREREEAEARAKREEEERQAEAARQQREMALQEIQGIQQQVFIAQVGRAGVREGGTIQCILETLAETEKWPIEESNFGVLTTAAQNAKDKAIDSIKTILAAARASEEEKAKVKAEADRLEKERIAKEQREREAQEKKDAKERARREKAEAEERERQRIAQEKMDAREMLDAFVLRFGHMEEFADVVKAIEALWNQHVKTATMFAEIKPVKKA